MKGKAGRFILSGMFVLMFIGSPSFLIEANEDGEAKGKSRSEILEAKREALKRKLAEKQMPKSPKFVGATGCTGSCHDVWYGAWKKTPHAMAYTLLKPGIRGEAKKKAGLDPDKDYTSDPQCLRCHTTGYKQKGGFEGPDSKNPTPPEEPDEPNLAAIGCEMCHSVMGGNMFRIVMKDKKEKFKRMEMEGYGQRFDYENVCKRCHGHANTPFKSSVDSKYDFNYEERKKKVHDYEKYITKDNIGDLITKDANGVSVHCCGKTETNPLPIEEWTMKKGKLNEKLWPVWDVEKKKIVWGGKKLIKKMKKKARLLEKM